jgi:hypothetical protein
VKRFVIVCSASIALATGVALAPLATTAAATASRTSGAAHTTGAAPGPGSVAHWSSRHGTLPTPRQVNLKTVSEETAGQHAGHVPPVRHFTARRQAAQRFAGAQSAGPRSSVKVLADSRQTVSGTSDLSASADPAGLPLMSLSEQVGLFGTDQEVEPPDTQVAAGPTELVEAVNSSLSVWSETGTLMDDADLNLFFPLPAGYSFTDPRVLYDASSGHFFLSGWAYDSSNDSQTYLAVSDTSDPTGNWTVYVVQTNTATLTDQPMLGVCDDNVVMAWNEFTGTGTSPTYVGAQALVLDKTALAAQTSPVDDELFTTLDEFRLVPAQALSSTSTCWMTVNNASTDLPGSTSTPTLGVIAITGSPVPASGATSGNVALTETDLPIAETNPPPDPSQPSGTTNDTLNDDRLVSAVWQDNVLWTSATDACTPPGDTTVRNCMRLDEVSTAGTAPTLVQDFDLGTPGLDEYYPAVGLDPSGDLFVAYSASSSTQYPGAYAVMSPASSMDAFTAPITIEAGSASYDGTRWGDYSDVATDPTTAGDMWVAGEYAPSDAATGDWGTAVAEVSLAAGFPAITSAAQATLPAGETLGYVVSATGSPAPTLAETGTLPAGVTFDTSTGEFSGPPAGSAVGVYPIQVTATNSVGTLTQNFTLTVSVPDTESVTALNYSNGTLALYTIRDDGNIWSEYQSAEFGSFSGWQPLTTAGDFTGTPAVIETNSGIIGIYARTTSGTVMGASQSSNGAPISAFSQIGPATDMVSDPDVMLTASGVVAIYGSESGGEIEGISQSVPNGAFGDWQVLSPADGFAGRPDVLQTASGVFAIYATTSSGTILGTSQSVAFGPFGQWVQLGSATDLVSDPTALLTASGVIAIYATDTNGAIEGISQFAPYSAFGSWQVLSPSDGFTGRPAVLQTSSGVIAIYALSVPGPGAGPIGPILGTSQSVPGGAFSPWIQIGTATDLIGPPAALITNVTHVIAIYGAEADVPGFGYLNGGVLGISQSVPFGPFGTWTNV